MNAHNQIEQSDGTFRNCRPDLIGMGQETLSDFVNSLEPLRVALADLITNGDRVTANHAKKLFRQLDTIAPSVTMIGQIKSGKTSLVNSMIGCPNLLPADVNPWTSVVTSLHVSPPNTFKGESASFKFFEQNEWDNLVSSGGRIGELAKRFGAETELVRIKEQVEKMRENSKKRLGRKFEVLLGQAQNYGYLDRDLIKRYVCLGDDFDETPDGYDDQGKFADITKSADIRLQNSAFPITLTIRDTPGVNDTFLMREQITIQSIRDSRICVVVLSAHQALSSTDMALIRLISNIKSREVIIFVNRIDELQDPKNQVEEIRVSIRETLGKHKGPKDTRIIFGSALWANYVLTGAMKELPEDSLTAILNWADETSRVQSIMDETQDSDALVWELSGLPDLFRAISERIVSGYGHEVVKQVSTSALNLANGLLRLENARNNPVCSDQMSSMSVPQVEAQLNTIRSTALTALENEIQSTISGFSARLDRIHNNFLERATSSLIQHLENYGEHSVWQYDPTGLRVLLSSSYKSLGSQVRKSYTSMATEAAVGVSDLYAQAFGTQPDSFEIKVTDAPRIRPPISLGSTMILDIKGSWWRSWWYKRRGYEAYAESFYALIKEETDGFINALRVDQAQAIKEDVEAALNTFLDEQRTIFLNLVNVSNGEAIDPLLGVSYERATSLKKIVSIFQEYLGMELAHE
jgi:hypothetical protein